MCCPLQKAVGLMAKDPVCNMNVSEAGCKYVSHYGGRTFYFCCEHCKKDFDSRPDKYAK